MRTIKIPPTEIQVRAAGAPPLHLLLLGLGQTVLQRLARTSAPKGGTP